MLSWPQLNVFFCAFPQGQYCDICSSANSNKAHPITNAIDGTERWWQSPPLSRGLEFNQVNVTLDLGQLFHVAYVLIKFANSPRPDLWVLERSTDFGLTYEPWQYFASSKRDCIEKFGLQTVDRISKDDHAICTTEYSRIVPLENGEIVVSLVNGRPGAMNFSYSPLLRNFTKATNIRLRFLQTNTLLGHLMGKALRDPTVTRRYYYSIKDISIGGRCVCHGHADVCDAKDPSDPYRYCDCQHNTCGGSCDRCCPGFNQFPWKPATADSANECQPCNCNGHAYDCYYDPEVDRHKASKSREDKYEGGGVCIDCQHHTTGVNCERCIPGYYRSPDHPIDSPYICYRCNCKSDFTDGTCEDLTGRCYCKPNYTGEHCDACAEGYLDFPHCYRKYKLSRCFPSVAVCGCSAVGTLPGGCDSSGRCFCRAEFAGPRCEQCSSGHHSYPHCYACQCSREGSLHSTCDQETGQCSCRPKVTGLRCDSCVPGAYGFPHCEGSSSLLLLGQGPWGPGHGVGSCACRAYVEGPACDRCKPLYWNLTPDNPYGCTSCKCETKGTISGIAECQQGNGQCFCKPNTCGQFCSACKDGYFSMENTNYFGCQGCRCDVGGSLGPSCEERSGACRCRQNTRGPTCTQPVRDHYFPDLHHLKFELEEGTTPAGRAVRFGYNPLEFEGFSWRGYAQMSSIQNKIRVTVNVKEAELYLFHVILRYINSGGATVYGKITHLVPSAPGTEQSKQIVFAPSTEPAFVTVPQNSFGEPFVLNPNTWSLIVEAEGVLLDYLVLLPSSYYEAPILQLKVTDPCTYQPAPEQATQNCLLYKYLSLDGFPAVAGVGAVCRLDNRLPRGCPTEQLTPSHPRMAMCSGNDVSSTSASSLAWWRSSLLALCGALHTPGQVIRRMLHASAPHRIQNLGRYAFILHYYQPNHPTFPVEVLINGGRIWQGQTNATFCPHGYGCRSLVVAEDQIVLDVTDNDLMVVVRVPEGKQLWLVSDYILVVPEDSYSSQYLQEEPLDKSYDFISSCGINSFYINPSTSSRFCRDSAISLSLFYNNGAQPCQCHEAGARGSQCEPFGGQCPCKSNVIGRECSRCATGYWGFPNCRPCDCGTRLCDEVTGQCICPPHTLKPECVVCEPQTFGCHPLIGCEDCNCSQPGVQELTELGCDVDSGQCKCKPNIIGRRCDLCAPGYYQYPSCRRCDCHPDGTEASVCDPVTGQCHCKENVEGPRCDQCRLGTFSLDASNPKGCTKCFCFGATNRCRSAVKYRAEFMDMNGWLLMSSDRQEVPTALNLREQLLHADLRNLLDAYQELYWVAPSSYHGDRVSSYGGHLRYELHSDPRRGDVFIPMESRPDVILKGNQMSIMFLEGSYPSPGEVHEGQLRLVESNFRHTETHNPVSREELMMVLANLEQLQIRALFSQLSSSVSLRRVVLEIATDTATGVPASNVELCFCPANYLGDSCQECAPGYYRDTKGLFLGKCIPCHCNGHSDQCLPGSGICTCTGCMHHTAGVRCEVCAPGFYGDAVCECRGGSCDPRTGECTCSNGLTGKQCDVCMHNYEIPVANGPDSMRCEGVYLAVLGKEVREALAEGFADCSVLWAVCDSCVLLLLEDLQSIEMSFPSIRSQSGAAFCLFNQLREYHRAMNKVRQRADELEDENTDLTQDLNALQHRVGYFSIFLPLPEQEKGYLESETRIRHFHSQAQKDEHQFSSPPPPVLHRVRSELHAHWESNQALVSSIQDWLAQHSSQLMDLRDALNEAVNKTRQTEDLNSLNRNNLEESQVDLHQAYEKLAALLDGAKLPLTERVKKFSPASSKIPIVEQAEEHARLLDELEEGAALEPAAVCAGYAGQGPRFVLGALCPHPHIQLATQGCFLPSPDHLRDFPPIFPEDTKETIQNAKAAATEANETAARVEDTLSTMKKNLDEWKDKYGGLRNEDLNQAVQDARKSVSSLESTIPLLLGKLSSLENRRNKNATVSENIVRIRQLITQARNAASKVKVPMKFNGSSGVQVRMPSNLQDLAAYTSLKFYIQNPEPRSQQDGAEEGRFVLYLGSREVSWDRRAAVGSLQWVYKLGNEEPASLTVDEEIGEQFAMSVIVERQTVHETKGDSVAKGEQGLLNLDPHNVVFYVGGYPPSFMPPPTLRYPNYRGCLELDTLNEEVVSLYNFQHTFQLDTTAEKPCSTGDPWLTDGSYFDGTGYAEIKFESQFGTTKRFEQEIRIISYNGILFFLENQAGATLLGSLHPSVSVMGAILAGVPRSGFRPSSKDRRHDQAGLCQPQPHAARGLSPRAHRLPLAVMGGQGAPVIPCPRRSHFSLEVRLNSSNGLLFYVAGKRGTFMALFVSNGRFIFLVNIGGRRLRIRSKEKYHDQRWHTVFFSRDQSRAQLVIDGLRAQRLLGVPWHHPISTGSWSHSTAPMSLHAHSQGLSLQGTSVSSFDGCLRNPQLDGKPLGTPSHTSGVTPCYEGALESGIFFAADGGSVTLADALATEQDLEVTLEVRPHSASGLIFHIGTRKSHHLMLYMEETKVTMRAYTGADELSTSVTCPSLCDGQWHTITGEGTALCPWGYCSAHIYWGQSNEASTVSALPPLPHYVGCIRNLLVNRSHVNLPHTRTVRGSVGLKGCPVL
uniref:Laminin subunit alpha 5 n=1 Tax=Pavo cristatus TaxID=9049 RepID=A0A8C9FGY1_PAVCR